MLRAKMKSPSFSPEIENNRLSGEIEMQNDGVLQISVPWNRGWMATVDGQKAELMRCGGMYMGLRLGAGAQGSLGRLEDEIFSQVAA